MASLSYIYSKSSNLKELYLNIDDKQFKFDIDTKNNIKNLKCQELRLSIKRGILDKSFKLYENDKLIMSARTFTFIRDYLYATYKIEILEKKDKLISVCCCVLMFVVISIQAIESTHNYMGKF